VAEKLRFEQRLTQRGAVQAQNGALARGLAAWMASAMSSLPVRLSTVMRTLALLGPIGPPARDGRPFLVGRRRMWLNAFASVTPVAQSRASWTRRAFSGHLDDGARVPPDRAV